MTSGNPPHGQAAVVKLIGTIAKLLETTIGPAVGGNRNALAGVTAAAKALRTAERALLADSADDLRQILAFGSETELPAAIRDEPKDAAAAGHAQLSTKDQSVTLPDRLPAVLGKALRLDAADVTIDNLRKLKTSSRGTWAFDAVTPDGRRAMVLGLHNTERDPLRAGIALQAALQRAGAARGLPVPRIVTADDSADALGSPFLISEKINGVSGVEIVRQLDSADLPASRARLLDQCARTLAGIHRVMPVSDNVRQDRLGVNRLQLDVIHDRSATFEWVFRWLVAHRLPPTPAVVAHGDYCMENLLVKGSDLRAVLDWEWAHVGEAYEDLSWFCIRAWRHGAPASLGAGGLGSIDDFLCAYEKASGTTIDRARFHWWLVLATLFRGITFRISAEEYLRQKVISPSYAVAGRRVCEIEWDLLELLDVAHLGEDAGRPRPQKEPGNQTQPGAAVAYGRPTAAELVASVTEYLEFAIESPAISPNDRAELTAAADILRTVERELRDSSADDARPPAPRGGPPTAELVASVAKFVETVVRPPAGQKITTHAEAVMAAASDALRIVERELLTGSTDDVTQALAGLGFTDERQLAAAIRNGDLDDRSDDVASCLRTVVNQRLAVANPGYQNE